MTSLFNSIFNESTTKKYSYLFSRWLRLLFGREYTLLDLLVMWDAIIGVGDDLKFTYYILVAMLIRIRDKCMFVVLIMLDNCCIDKILI